MYVEFVSSLFITWGHFTGYMQVWTNTISPALKMYLNLQNKNHNSTQKFEKSHRCRMPKDDPVKLLNYSAWQAAFVLFSALYSEPATHSGHMCHAWHPAWIFSLFLCALGDLNSRENGLSSPVPLNLRLVTKHDGWPHLLSSMVQRQYQCTNMVPIQIYTMESPRFYNKCSTGESLTAFKKPQV